jgi:hypothetical protein
LGFRPRSDRRPIPLVKTRSQQPAHQVLDALPGKPAAARRVLAPASSPSSGGVPSSRWGASRWVASALHTWTVSLAKNRATGEKPTARRVARGAGVRRRHGYVLRPVARRAWVHALGCARPWASARPNLQEDYTTARRPDSRNSRVAHDATSRAGASGVSTAGSWPRRAGVRPAWTHALNHCSEGKIPGSTAGKPEPRARCVATSRHGGASRGFPSTQRTGVRRDASTKSAHPRGLG